MVDQDENESGNPGHTHPGASALLWGGVFYRERGESRVASRLTDSSESEEDLSSDDPEQEGAALDVREGAKKCHFLPHLKTKTDNGLDTNKQKKEEVPSRPAPMMRSTLAELHYIPEKTLSITLIRES